MDNKETNCADRLTEHDGHEIVFKRTANGRPIDMNMIAERLAAYEDAEEMEREHKE